MALFLLCPNLGWIQGQFNFTELSLRYPLEGWRAEKVGEEKRVSTISAGAGGVVGGVVAVIVRVLGGG